MAKCPTCNAPVNLAPDGDPKYEATRAYTPPRKGNQFYGWYDDATQAKDNPTCDPPHDAPCPFCGEPITADDVRTHALMYVGEYAARSYFYRTHRTCAEKDPTHTAMDGFILDMIARNGD